MDSWSRPSKSQATPAPLYLTHPDTHYCHTCGRIIGDRKSTRNKEQEVKYCSARCRSHKPRAIDRKIESVFTALLDGASLESLKNSENDAQGSGGAVQDAHEKSSGKSGHGKKGEKGKKHVKGDPRLIIECGTVEELVFQREKDPLKVHGRRKNRAARGVVENEEDWRSVDMVDDPAPAVSHPVDHSRSSDKNRGSDSNSDDGLADGGVALNEQDGGDMKPLYGYGGGKVRPPQAESDINGSVGGEKGWAERIHETPEMLAKRKGGERRAEEKEMVKRAARRLVAFGVGDGEDNRKCEAVMKGVVVESSFAKGEWGIRWREKV